MRWPVDAEDPIPSWAVWHSWFAWRPVRVGNERVWFEWVERKGEEHAAYDSSWIEWEYRLLDHAAEHA